MKHIFTDGIFHIYVEDVNKWIYHGIINSL